MSKKLNGYKCQECSKVTYVLNNTVEGVTPFIHSCFYCGGDAISLFFEVPQDKTAVEEFFTAKTVQEYKSAIREYKRYDRISDSEIVEMFGNGEPQNAMMHRKTKLHYHPREVKMEAVKLKPCPFCCKQPYFNQVGAYYDDYKEEEIQPDEWQIGCEDCSVIIIPGKKDHLIELWNRRPIKPKRKTK